MNDAISNNFVKKQENYWKLVVALFCLGWTVLWINRTILNPILPEIMQDLNIKSEASAGLINTLFFLPYTLLQVPSGFLGDKYGRKAVLVPGLILFGLGSIFGGFAMTFSIFLFARILTGIGQGTYFGPVYALSSDIIPTNKRGVSTAIINSGTALGMAMGMIISSLLVKELQWSWRSLMILSGLIGILTAFIFLKFLKSKKEMEEIYKTIKVDDTNTQNDKGYMKEFIKNPKLFTTSIVYFATCYSYFMVVTWLPSFLEQERGFQGAAIGLAASLVAFTSVPGALIFSRISDKHKDKKIPLIIFLHITAAVMLCATVAAKNNTMLITALILYGLLGKLAVDPILVSYLADISPKDKTTATFGLYNFFGMSGSVMAPYITGMISDATGSKIVGFYIAAMLLILCLGVFIFGNVIIKNKQPKDIIG